MPSAVLDWELNRPLHNSAIVDGCDAAVLLLRWRGRPLARLRLTGLKGRLTQMAVWQAAQDSLKDALIREVLPAFAHDPVPRASGPACTAVVCTRDRASDLRQCLRSLSASLRPQDEIVVVDNAPSDDSTEKCVREFPVRYVREMRKGLNWARARGLREAGRDIVAFTDDDVVVDPQWITGLSEPFADPAVGGVTGLIMPAELNTAAQEMFEAAGGFVSHFKRRTFHAANIPPAAAGQVGAGANMAFRRQMALDLGLFDCEMDCGTSARSGGDHYAFYRALRAGQTIVFNPEAVCWHRHRRTEAELRSTLYGYSVGVYTFLLRCLLIHRDLTAIRVGSAWFVQHHLRNLWAGLRGKSTVLPLRFTWDEVRGATAALQAYRAVRRAERDYPSMPAAGACR